MQTMERNLKMLSKLAAANNLPHALLFTGPERIGKKNAALKFLDGLKYEKSNFTLLAESPITIKQIRDLKRKFSLTSFENLRKVAIIENADAMRAEAANAFLKLLEEPRGDALFILIAHTRSSVLATIASRAVEIRFPGPRLKISASPHGKTIQIFEEGFLYEKFREAKRFNLQNKLELAELFDAWLVKLRFNSVNATYPLHLLKKIFSAKRNILATNANPQIIIEELILCAVP
jgi:hypothetical protein